MREWEAAKDQGSFKLQTSQSYFKYKMDKKNTILPLNHLSWSVSINWTIHYKRYRPNSCNLYTSWSQLKWQLCYTDIKFKMNESEQIWNWQNVSPMFEHEVVTSFVTGKLTCEHHQEKQQKQVNHDIMLISLLLL